LLASFFGAIAQKGKIEDVFEKAYQKQQAAEAAEIEKIKPIPMEEPFDKPEPLPGQMRLNL